MSHVDEGTLHAYLDGELPSGDRATLEAHVAECAACRAALADERALRDRASALLGSARPVERPAPPLEQLRRSTKRSPWHVRTSFAWAASIVLALSIGYVLRGPGGDSATANQQRPIVVAADRAVGPPPAAATAKRAAPPMRREAPTRQHAPIADEVAQAQEKVDSVATVAPNLASRVAVEPSAAGKAVAPAPRESLRLNATVAAAAVAAEQDRAAVGAVSVQPSAALNWPVITRRTAESLLGAAPVGLPGLGIRTIRRSPAGDGTVVVEQALDFSTVIQVFQRPAGAALENGLRRERTDRLLARFMGKLRVEIAGPVSVDSLNRLLEQVQPLP